MKYLCFGSNNLTYAILDRENKKYLYIREGIISDETKNCEKMYKRKSNQMGTRYYGYLLGENDLQDCIITKSEILLDTDDRRELDLFIMNSQVKQLKFKLEYIETNVKRVKNNTCKSNLYTY